MQNWPNGPHTIDICGQTGQVMCHPIACILMFALLKTHQHWEMKTAARCLLYWHQHIKALLHSAVYHKIVVAIMKHSLSMKPVIYIDITFVVSVMMRIQWCQFHEDDDGNDDHDKHDDQSEADIEDIHWWPNLHSRGEPSLVRWGGILLGPSSWSHSHVLRDAIG